MLTRTNSHRQISLVLIMLTDHKVLLLGCLLFCLFFLNRIRRVRHIWKPFGSLPAYSTLVSPVTIYGRMLPRLPGISAGADFIWRNVYERKHLPTNAFPSLSPLISQVSS